MTLVGAIATASGFTDWADKRRVRLLRQGKTTEHDLTKISVNPEMDIPLQPEDKVIVIHR
jgi:protein involved in polysaccharide export with SLBB domain